MRINTVGSTFLCLSLLTFTTSCREAASTNANTPNTASSPKPEKSRLAQEIEFFIKQEESLQGLGEDYPPKVLREEFEEQAKTVREQIEIVRAQYPLEDPKSQKIHDVLNAMDKRIGSVLKGTHKSDPNTLPLRKLLGTLERMISRYSQSGPPSAANDQFLQ